VPQHDPRGPWKDRKDRGPCGLSGWGRRGRGGHVGGGVAYVHKDVPGVGEGEA